MTGWRQGLLVAAVLLLAAGCETPQAVGGIYTVRRGDTFLTVARRTGLAPDVIARVNRLHAFDPLTPGQKLYIPSGKKTVYGSTGWASGGPRAAHHYTAWYPPPPATPRIAPPPARAPAPPAAGEARAAAERRAEWSPPRDAPRAALPGLTAGLGWPLPGPITSGYGWRRGRMHKGIDIRARRGTRVRAAEDGIVLRSGWRRGFGNIVVISHGGGLQTLYAHNRRNLVRSGEWVRRGQVISEVGATGNARGPHLHFEIRQGGRSLNPVEVLHFRSASR